MSHLAAELRVALNTADAMARHQAERFYQDYRVLRKEAREFVTNIDLECHELARKLLSQTAPVLSEETRGNDQVLSDRCWIVDPLDGSHNYIAGLPNFGVSIALVEDQRFVIGVINLPSYKEQFHAVEGCGAFLNGEPIAVSSNPALSKSMIAYDNQFHLSSSSFPRFQRVVSASFTTRILGSAVYDMGLVARGRIDARIFNCTKVFDVAAGVVLVREAGGRVTDFQGAEVSTTTREIVASNVKTHDDLLTVLEDPIDEEACALYGGIGLARSSLRSATLTAIS